MLENYLSDQYSEDCQRVIADLRSQIAQIPIETFVQKAFADIEQAWMDSFRLYLNQTKVNFLRSKVAPFLRFVAGTDVPAATFTNKIERLKHEILTNSVKAATLESIAEDVSRLPVNLIEGNPKQQAAFEFCLSGRLRTASPNELNQVIEALAGQMRNRQDKPSAFVELDLRDRIANSGYITLGDGGEQVYVQEYRERVERKVLEIVENHPAIAALRHGEAPTDLQLVALERMFRQELGAKLFSDDGSAETPKAAEESGTYRVTAASTDAISNIRKAFNVRTGSLLGFLREQLEMEELPDYETVVQRNFEQYIAQQPYNVDQIRFLRTVQTVFLQKRCIELADLYDEPLDRFGEDAVERWFT